MLSTIAYRAVVAAAVPLAPLWLRDPARRRGHDGRRAAAARLIDWARTHRDASRPLAWFHASSVGEGLQARAVLRAFRRLRPDTQVIVTRFSASADRLGDAPEADFTGYLPYDRRRELARVLDAVRPTLLVFAKVDVWPELTTLARARGTRVALVAATVDPGSRRLGAMGRWVAARGYQALHLATAISSADAERLVTLGVARDRITVTGDPRVDVVLEGVDRHRDGVLHDGSLLVAGSTWPGDESVLLDALVAIRRDHPQARLVIAPHEPTADHLAILDREIASRGLASTRWSAGGARMDAVQVVDQMGVLAALYGRGAIAYVGGGFGGRGIHSVLEPAAWARPVIIGPNDRGVRDAALLAEAGGLVRLPVQDPRAALVTRWRAWLADPVSRARAGDAARAALEADRGAAERSAELLCSLLDTIACRFAQLDT